MLRVFGVAVTVFGTGWVLMGLEIVGGRMLAPYFGSGVWVWGSVISVFLAALSIGYFCGGLLSQRFPTGLGLAAVILLSAVWLVPVALWYQPVSDWLSLIEIHERWGSLLAATVLFLPPSALMGMVSPYAVRLVAQNVEAVGRTAGTLYAISTAGSFLGCLLTAFYFILWFGIRQILLLSAAALCIIALWLLVTWYVGGHPQQKGVS